jgi:molybdopterin-guanine dinucleotide biosynthesis protein A
MSSEPLAGIVLAGGRSQRMGGTDKALQLLAGEPLIGHVIDRVQRQVGAMALSVERPTASLERFGLPQLADPLPGHRGPLGGLLSALRHYGDHYPWVLLVPCDAPFLPATLAASLLRCALDGGLPGAMAVYRGEWQPTFSVWHRSLLPDLERAVGGEGLGGFKQLLRTVRVAERAWPTDAGPDVPSPFFNVNDRAALEEAECWLRRAEEGAQTCSA